MGRVSGFSFSGSVDAVFVQTEHNVILSNSLPFSGHLSTIQPTINNRPGRMTTVAMVGHFSRGETWGQVVDDDHRGTLNGVFFTNLTRTNIRAIGGDSGGLVFITGSNIVAGLVMANDPANNAMIFVKSDLAHAVLGVEMY